MRAKEKGTHSGHTQPASQQADSQTGRDKALGARPPWVPVRVPSWAALGIYVLSSNLGFPICAKAYFRHWSRRGSNQGKAWQTTLVLNVSKKW